MAQAAQHAGVAVRTAEGWLSHYRKKGLNGLARSVRCDHADPALALGLTLSEADFTDTHAIASIARITGGNFRLLHTAYFCKLTAS